MEVKTQEEIAVMKKGGVLLSQVLGRLAAEARVGRLMSELDQLAEGLLRQGGGQPSFLGYTTKREKRPFPASLCISRNNEIVHGPGSREIKLAEGDVVGFDLGVRYQGFCTDMAVTVPVGEVSSQAGKLISDTRAALLAGLEVIRAGAKLSAIGQAVEAYARPRGYGIVRDLVGHGVGRLVHEDPQVPNYYDQRFDSVILPAGLTLAVEPMLTTGDWRVKTLDDGWTIVTADGSLAAHFEVTIVITEQGYEVLTPWVV